MKLPESNLRKIDSLRFAGGINRLAITAGLRHISSGQPLKDVDDFLGGYIRGLGGIPAFNGYMGFPRNACISLNNEVVHGIADNRIAEDGDIVTVDVGTQFGEHMVDSAVTAIVGTRRNPEDVHLVKYAQEVLLGGLLCVAPGKRLVDVARRMDDIAHQHYLTIIPELGGHRIGKTVHEKPFIPMTLNTKGLTYDYDYVLKPGDLMCFEPIVVLADRSPDIEVMSDGWTVKTKDGGPSAHFEHTVLVTEHGHEVIS